MPASVRGRYAPSPTGRIHLGNARTALVAWLACRSAGGAFVWRLEDLDGPRTVPGMAEAAVRDLRWLGLDWDEGPDVGGPHAPYGQSERFDLYEQALDRLHAAGRLFPCRVSRRELQEVASAPHGHEGLPPYPAHLRPSDLAPDWYAAHVAAADPDAALRFRVDAGEVAFDDRVQGRVCERVDEAVGDFVVKRRDGVYAYQLAVVVDDLLMGIDQVVRGEDLLDSTARQIQLVRALGGTPPAYAHVPLAVDGEGEKLSKRHDALALGALRDAGVVPEAVVGVLARSLGLADTDAPLPATALVERFAWARIPKTPWRVEEGLAERLRAEG